MAEILRQYMVKVDSAQEKVYRTLRDEILSMVLKPGTIISTQEIAGLLGVSRTPVREAFIRLQGENLLDVAPQKGTAVALIDLDRVYQERFIREALEAENLRRFVPAASEQTIADMRNNILLQKDAMQNGRCLEYKELDDQFHQLAFETTHEELSADIVRQVNGHYDRIRLITAWEGNIAFNAIEEHSRLVDCVEQRDVERAQQLLRSHLQQLWVQERSLMELYPDYFKQKLSD